jgi:hypothetical protein
MSMWRMGNEDKRVSNDLKIKITSDRTRWK